MVGRILIASQRLMVDVRSPHRLFGVGLPCGAPMWCALLVASSLDVVALQQYWAAELVDPS